jgi:hypothetical protein
MRDLGADGFWNAAKSCGWVDDLPKGERTTLRMRIQKEFAKEPVDGYLGLATVRVPSSGFGIEGSYVTAVEAFAQGSYNIFNPVKIREERILGTGEVTVSFKHKGSTYKFAQKKKRAWFDEGLVDVINRALMNVRCKLMFIALPNYKDNVEIFTFISERTFQKAQERGLVPPDDYALAWSRM